MNYDDTFYSKLNSDIQEKIFMAFMSAHTRDKILLFTKLKYGEEITFKELSEKMHFSTVRSVYTNYIHDIKSGLLSDNICLTN